MTQKESSEFISCNLQKPNTAREYLTLQGAMIGSETEEDAKLVDAHTHFRNKAFKRDC